MSAFVVVVAGIGVSLALKKINYLMTYKSYFFLVIVFFLLNPSAIFSQGETQSKTDSKFELEIGYMLPFYNIDQQQFHFGTNVPYTVSEETSSKSTFAFGLLYTEKLSSSLGLLLGIMNYYGDYQITFNYFERGSSEAERKFVHDIKSFAPLSPIIGLKLSSGNPVRNNHFRASLGLGLKPIVNIDDKRTHIVEKNNFEREEDSIIEDTALIYPFLKASYSLENIIIGLSYNHRLYNFIYKQDNSHINDGDIFNVEISHLTFLISLKF